jgi:hypothetical protein
MTERETYGYKYSSESTVEDNREERRERESER